MKQIKSFFIERQNFGIKPGLSRIKKLLTRLGNPQEKLKAIHIAGTNGKGSTLNYIRNALIANGNQVGVFTSPSMMGITGHFFINNETIKDENFIQTFNNIYPSIQQMDEEGQHTTEFEIMTAIAFVYFSRNVDIALIETGMGGREDATNCVQPLLTIITNVSRDHGTFLGRTIEQIASHKAGIIKANIPVIIGKVQSPVIDIISQEAHLKKAPVYRLNSDFMYVDVESMEAGENYYWQDSDTKLAIKLTTKGTHQIENSSVALKALKVLKDQGFSLDKDKTLKSICQTEIPGRFETIHDSPLIILDGAHNPAGIDSFIETATTRYRQVEKHLIFGIFKDKELNYMIKPCIPHFQSITLTSFQHKRAAGFEELYKYSTYSNVQFKSDWEDQISNILGCPSDEKGAVYFITGSLNFISQVREKMKEWKQL